MKKRSVAVVLVSVLAWSLSGCTIALVGVAQHAMKSKQPPVAEDQRLADLGHSALSGGSFKLAEAYLVEALESNPDNPYALHDLSIVYVSTNRSEKAQALYVKLARLEPPGEALPRGDGDRRGPTELLRR
jgi:Tfp pilus assembly protein PilF